MATVFTQYPIFIQKNIYKGDTFKFTIRWGSRSNINTVYRNLTNWQAKFKIRDKNRKILYESTPTDVKLNINPYNNQVEDGWITITVNNNITENFPEGLFDLDLELQNPDNEILTLYRIKGKIIEDIT